VATTDESSCAILDDGQVKCWGYNFYGQLGLGDTANRGGAPGDMGDNLPAVSLGTGRTAVALSLSYGFSCALLDDHQIKCWGANMNGNLGTGDTSSHGDAPGTMGDALPAVNLGAGRSALAVGAGAEHVCALLDIRQIKCWGDNPDGELGLGDTMTRGDKPGEMGDNLPATDLGN
jgi:alpha-tubulin suppressor-like RCC1 family protein